MPELVVGQAGKELTHNQALAVLDQLAQAVVVDKDLTAPPGSPANGAMYIVAASATGAWSGQSGKLAYWLTTVAAWTFITPANGWSVWVTDEAVRYERKAGIWVVVSSAGGATLPVVQELSSTRSLALVDINTFNVNSTTSDYVATIPAQATVAWTADAEMHFLPSNTGEITITAAAGVSLNGVVAGSLTLSTQNGAATLKRIGSNSWTLIGAIEGDFVFGPASSTDNAIARFDSTTGKLLQNSGVTITDAGEVIAASASMTDTTPGRLMPVGSFGLGTTPTTGVDLDTLTVTGFFVYAFGTPNAPTTNGGSVIHIARDNNNRPSQLAVDYVSNSFYLRSYAGVSWSYWSKLWSSTGVNQVTVATGFLGYGTGSGGTVTQATSKSTGVTLNKPSGQITMAAAALAANTAVSFTLTNSTIAAHDVPNIVIKSGATAGSYGVAVDAVAAGSCRISIRNMTVGSLSETLVLQFNIEKGAIA